MRCFIDHDNEVWCTGIIFKGGVIQSNVCISGDCHCLIGFIAKSGVSSEDIPLTKHGDSSFGEGEATILSPYDVLYGKGGVIIECSYLIIADIIDADIIEEK